MKYWRTDNKTTYSTRNNSVQSSKIPPGCETSYAFLKLLFLLIANFREHLIWLHNSCSHWTVAKASWLESLSLGLLGILLKTKGGEMLHNSLEMLHSQSNRRRINYVRDIHKALRTARNGSSH